MTDFAIQEPTTNDFVRAIDKEIAELVSITERTRLTTKDVAKAVTKINFYREILNEEGYNLPEITEGELMSMLSGL